MHQAGKPVDYVLYPDEGHGFRPENRLHFCQSRGVFSKMHQSILNRWEKFQAIQVLLVNTLLVYE